MSFYLIKPFILAHQNSGSMVVLTLGAGFAVCCFFPSEAMLRGLVPGGELSTCSVPLSFPQLHPRRTLLDLLQEALPPLRYIRDFCQELQLMQHLLAVG